MKNAMYAVLLTAEFVIGFLMLSLAGANVSWMPCVIAVALWAVLTVWQVGRLKKANADRRGSIKRNIALVMLIPLLTSVIMILWLFVDLANHI